MTWRSSWGKSAMISSTVMPSAIIDTIVATVMRVPGHTGGTPHDVMIDRDPLVGHDPDLSYFDLKK